MARGRPPSLRRSAPVEVALDEEIRARLDIALWSPAENRVPRGAYKSFFDRAVARELTFASLDLAPFLGCEPGINVVYGNPSTIEALSSLLKAQSHDS